MIQKPLIRILLRYVADKRYGIAVGFDDKEINYAKDTVELLYKGQEQLNTKSQNSVRDFALYCKSRFMIL